MDKIFILEFFLIELPSAFLFIFAAYALSKVKINLKRYFIGSLLLALVVLLTGVLPIHSGMNIILNMVALILIIVNINEIDIMRGIKSTILIIFFECISELLNIYILQMLLSVDKNYIHNIPHLKVVYGIPSLVIFALIIFSYYGILRKRKELTTTNYGEVK